MYVPEIGFSSQDGVEKINNMCMSVQGNVNCVLELLAVTMVTVKGADRHLFMKISFKIISLLILNLDFIHALSLKYI